MNVIAEWASKLMPYGGERSYTNTCTQNYKFEGMNATLKTRLTAPFLN